MTKIFKIPLTICFFLIFLLFSGCSKDSQGQDAKTPVQEETAQGKDIQPSMASEGETATSENQEVLPEGKVVFTGVEWSREDEEKYAVYKGSLDICADRDNGGVYYVNWGYDKYLYYWKDGKTKLVLDKWVSQICYMDGMVYCLYDKTGKSYIEDTYPSYEGIICSVNVKTGEFKKLFPVKAKMLAVCKDGIYYYWLTGPDVKEQKREGGFYSFKNQEITNINERLENSVFQETYGKYSIIYRKDGRGAYLRNLENGNEQPFIYEDSYIDTLFIHICAGRCYYRIIQGSSKKGYVMNLKNGETHRIGSPIISQYLVQLNENTELLYTTNGGSGQITAYNPVKDKHKDIDIKNAYSSIHSNYFMDELYSDTRYLYTIAHNGKRRGKIVGLVVLEAGGEEISEIWSSLEYYNTKKKKQK